MSATDRTHLKRVPGRNLFFKPELDNGNIALVTPRGEPVGTIWFRPTAPG